MNSDFHPARIKGLAAALLDVLFVVSLVAVLAVAMLTLLNNSARDRIARGYARQFGLRAEEACPPVLGKAFWFACASEVRQMRGIEHPETTPATGPKRGTGARVIARPS